MTIPRTSPSAYDLAAWILTGLALLLVFPLRLFAALMAGLLVFELVRSIAPLLRITKISDKRAKVVVVGFLAALIVAALALLIWKVVAITRSEAVSVPNLLLRMAEILDGARAKLPSWAAENLPENVEEINQGVATWLRGHAATMQEAGKGVGLALAHILLGLILGAIVSLTPVTAGDARGPLAAALVERVHRISEAFRSVVFAQVRISALNTGLTFLYLAVILPAAGVRLPFVKTMVAITFFAGLLPVVGNLISNSVIVIVSLSVSFTMALWSLGFLIAVHKLEYFLNARIIGGQIRAKTWELLVAMLVMESAFGMAGVAAAPIYYAYMKKELSDQGLI